MLEKRNSFPGAQFLLWTAEGEINYCCDKIRNPIMWLYKLTFIFVPFINNQACVTSRLKQHLIDVMMTSATVQLIMFPFCA